MALFLYHNKAQTNGRNFKKRPQSVIQYFKHLNVIRTVVIGVFVFGLGNIASASYENTTQLGIEKKKNQIQLVNSFNYRMSSDAFDSNDRKVFNHGLGYNGTLFFLDKYYANAGLAATYHSVDSTIIQEDNGAYHLSDAVLGLGTKGFQLYKGNSDSLSLFNNIRNVVPLSDRSRNEGYKSLTSVSGDLAYQRGPISFVLTGQYSYVFNSFETNTDGLYNLRSSTVAGLTARYNYKKLRLQYSYRFGVLEYMDGNRLGSSGNTLSIMALFNKSLWAGISTSNLSYAEEQYVDVWFYDPFRRIYNLTLGVTF